MLSAQNLIILLNVNVGTRDLEVPPTRKLQFPEVIPREKDVVQRALLSPWFNKWKWIHHNETADTASCHVCIKADKADKLKAN